VLTFNNKLITNKGSISIKDLATKYSGLRSVNLNNRWYTAKIKTDYRIVAQAKNFQIVPKEKFLVMNEKGEWKKLNYIYFYGSSGYYFNVQFFTPNLINKKPFKTNQYSLKCHLRQRILVFHGDKLKWKRIPELNEIGKEYIRLKSDVDELYYGEYMGIYKVNYNVQLASIHAEDSVGVCIEPGIVVHCIP